MKRLFLAVAVLAMSISLSRVEVFAHVPYFEHRDFTQEQPFKVRKSIEQSIAVYAWLKFEDSYTEDIDVYTFELTAPVRVFIQSLVPECDRYKKFLPWFAIVGPGLPEPGYTVPVDIPPGCGAVVVENYDPEEDRPTFYEPFGGKSYYQGPEFDQILDEPGTYFVYFWDPYSLGGDYVAVLGYEETWESDDILRALIYTPMIRRDKELHTDCR
ncbi:MAG: hypothetical protein AB1847_16305 [bacterium]